MIRRAEGYFWQVLECAPHEVLEMAQREASLRDHEAAARAAAAARELAPAPVPAEPRDD